MSCWPQAPGAKSPFFRNGRNDFRCGEMIGSPPRPGTSVNSVATISMPRLRAARTSGASLSGSAAMAGLALSGAAIGAVAMQEIVLQIAENKRAGRRSSGGLHDQIAERDRSGRQGPARSRWSRRAARGWPARRSVASTGKSSRAHTAVSRQPPSNQTGRDPSRAFSSDADGSGRKHREIERRAAADRRDAQRHDAHREAGQQAAERGQIGGLEGASGPWPSDHAEAVALQRDRQRHGNGVGLPEIVHVELVLTRRSARPRCPRRR